MEKKNPNSSLVNRLSRIEGQINGIKKMLDNETACLDIISQVMAVREAVSSLAVEIIKGDFACKKSKEVDEKYLKMLFKVN